MLHAIWIFSDKIHPQIKPMGSFTNYFSEELTLNPQLEDLALEIIIQLNSVNYRRHIIKIALPHIANH